MTPIENIHGLSAPYALDALDDIERRRFEQHLAEGCDTCALEVSEFLEVAAALGEVEEAPVSDALRAHALRVPETVRQVGPPGFVLRARHASRRLTSVAAAVLLVVAVGLSVVTVGQANRLDELDQLAAVLEQPDAISLAADTGEGTVRLIGSPSTGTAAVLAAGLTQAPEGQTYQLWWIDADGAARSAGLFDVAEDGSGRQLITGDVANAAAFGVSVEPAGGSTAPTTDPIAVLPLGA